MCGLCGTLGGAEHWSEGAGASVATGARQRQLRTRLANAVLGHYGLALDEWAGSLILRSRTGQSAIIPHLGALWPAAERLADRRCDPLEPDLISALERTG